MLFAGLSVDMKVWFDAHLYLALFLAAFMEGMGLPVPAELLFVAAAGRAPLNHVIAAAVAGNLAGALFGFGLAYVGGQRLIRAVSAAVRLSPEAFGRVESFFERYGAGTVFVSRFIGPIRAATVYAAGAARMEPWRFAVYMLSAIAVWNTAWAWLAFRFGARLPHLVHHVLGSSAVWVVAALGLAAVAGLLLRRRRPAPEK